MTACDQTILASTSLPDDAALAADLSRLLGTCVTILERRSCDYSSTFPAELTTCALGDGSPVRLFIKYSGGTNHNAYGHRGGIEYEASIYQRLLEPLGALVPKCHGLHQDSAGGYSWLVLEDLEGAVGVHWDPTNLPRAAAWIGNFHAACEGYLASTKRLTWLNAHSVEYFREWASRTVAFSNGLTHADGWLQHVAHHAEQTFGLLCEGPSTVIHGEYYRCNLLARDGKVFPVDWESAARSNGAIDLASLIEGWPEPQQQACIESYRKAHWRGPRDVPGSFDETLDAACLYLHFRWLGERPEWTGKPSNHWRFERLRQFAEQRGLL
jgi:hypothetical protein